MPETWTEIERVEPEAKRYRAACTEDGCAMHANPVPFVSRDAASSWARAHANDTSHVAVVEGQR